MESWKPAGGEGEPAAAGGAGGGASAVMVSDPATDKTRTLVLDVRVGPSVLRGCCEVPGSCCQATCRSQEPANQVCLMAVLAVRLRSASGRFASLQAPARVESVGSGVVTPCILAHAAKLRAAVRRQHAPLLNPPCMAFARLTAHCRVRLFAHCAARPARVRARDVPCRRALVTREL